MGDMNIKIPKPRVVAADIVVDDVEDLIYTIVVLRDDQVERIAQRVVDLLGESRDEIARLERELQRCQEGPYG